VRQKEEQILAEATFKPQLTSKRSSTPTKAGAGDESVYSRLSKPAEKDMSALYAIVDAENTFQPVLVAKRSASVSARGVGIKLDLIFATLIFFALYFHR